LDPVAASPALEPQNRRGGSDPADEQFVVRLIERATTINVSTVNY
jgi:hypothetical protein